MVPVVVMNYEQLGEPMFIIDNFWIFGFPGNLFSVTKSLPSITEMSSSNVGDSKPGL